MSQHILQDYEDVKSFVNNSIKPKNNHISTEDIYQTLMAKEEVLLSTLNQMNANEMKLQEQTSLKYIMTTPLHVLIKRIFIVINETIKELSNIKEVTDVFDIVLHKDKRIYLGIFFIIISIILLMFISV